MGIIIKTIFSFIFFWGGVILLFSLNKRVKNKSSVNYILAGTALFFYVLLIVTDGQYHHWDEATILDVHPLSKMSPFLFATALLAEFLPQTIKKYYHTILSSLLLAMAAVGIFASLADGMMNDMNYFVVWMYFDAVSHLTIALFGLWLAISGQLSFERKVLVRSLGILYAFLLLLIVLNLIFKTNFFGLTTYGGHNIYGVVIDPWILSFVAYFAGITVISLAGWFVCKALAAKAQRAASSPAESVEPHCEEKA